MTQSPPARRRSVEPNAVAPDSLAEQFVGLARRLDRATRPTMIGSLSHARYDVLHTVFHHDGISMGDLAARLGVVARTVTGLTDGLEHDGLLQRVPDSADRRRINLTVTAEGRTVLRTARRSRIAKAAGPFRALSDDERTELHRLLTSLDNELDQMEP